jgi:hypothetical protein
MRIAGFTKYVYLNRKCSSLRDTFSGADEFINPITIAGLSIYCGAWGAVMLYMGFNPNVHSGKTIAWFLLGSLALCLASLIVGFLIKKR